MPLVSGAAAYTLTGAFVTQVFYGVYLILFGGMIRMLCFKSRLTATKAFLLPASIVMFCLITVSIILDSVIVFAAVIISAPDMDPDDYINGNFSGRLQSTRDTLQMITVLIADAILVYRAWIVWKPKRIPIAFSILLYLLSCAFILKMIVTEFTPEGRDQLGPYAYGYLASTLAQNVVTTCLILYRLWSVDAASSAYKEGSLMPIVWILAESGCAYVAYVLLQLLSLRFGESVGNAFACLPYSVQAPVIGIVNSLIVVRIGARYGSSSSRPSRESQEDERRTPELIQVTIVRETEEPFEDISSICESAQAKKE